MSRNLLHTCLMAFLVSSPFDLVHADGLALMAPVTFTLKQYPFLFEANRRRNAAKASPENSLFPRSLRSSLEIDDTSDGLMEIPSTTSTTLFSSLRGGALGPGNPKNLLMTFIKYVGVSESRCWTLLVLSVTLEILATSLSKRAKDTGSVGMFLVAGCLYLICMGGFNISLSKIEIGIAYAVWSAVGTSLVTIVGIFVFGEKCDLAKVACLAMIIGGVIGLNLRGKQ